MSLPKILVPCAVGKTGIVVAFGVFDAPNDAR
jgi:hypothetical protein